MATVKIATVNGERMNDRFTANADVPAVEPTFTRDRETCQTAHAAGRPTALIQALDADVVALMEAPCRGPELTLFVSQILSDDAGAPVSSVLLGDCAGNRKRAQRTTPGVSPPPSRRRPTCRCWTSRSQPTSASTTTPATCLAAACRPAASPWN